MSDRPLSCARAREWIDPQVAGELDPSREARLARHLMGCVECAAELGTAERVEAELRALPALDAPPRLVARIKAAAPAPAAAPRHARGLRWRPVAAAATLALLLAAGWWWGERSSSPGRPTATGVAPPSARVTSEPTVEEIARATEEARLALALVARLGRKARDELRDEVLIERVATPVIDGLERRLGPAGERGAPS